MNWLDFKEICKKNKERENNINNMCYFFSQKLCKKINKAKLRQDYGRYFSYYLWQKAILKEKEEKEKNEKEI